MRAFIEVAQSASFAEAAKKLYLSQPALSTSIKNMEAQLGGKLFLRSTRRMELTPEGKNFLPKAKRVLADYDAALEDVRALFKVQQGNLVISAMPSFAEGQLASILQEFTSLNPNINIRVLDVVMEQVLDNVLAQRAEIGFVFAPQNLQGLSFTPLFTDSFCVVMPPDHELAVKKRCKLDDLYQYPFVAMNRESSIRRWLDETLLKANAKINIVAEATQLGTIGQLVANHLGIAIVPQLCKEQMQNKGLVVKSIVDLNFEKQVGLVMHEPANLSAAGTSLLNFIRQQG